MSMFRWFFAKFQTTVCLLVVYLAVAAVLRHGVFQDGVWGELDTLLLTGLIAGLLIDAGRHWRSRRHRLYHNKCD